MRWIAFINSLAGATEAGVVNRPVDRLSVSPTGSAATGTSLPHCGAFAVAATAIAMAATFTTVFGIAVSNGRSPVPLLLSLSAVSIVAAAVFAVAGFRKLSEFIGLFVVLFFPLAFATRLSLAYCLLPALAVLNGGVLSCFVALWWHQSPSTTK